MNARLLIAAVCAVSTHAGLGLWIDRTLLFMSQGVPEGDPARIEVSLVAGSSEDTNPVSSDPAAMPSQNSNANPVETEPEPEVPPAEMPEPEPSPKVESPPQPAPEPPPTPVEIPKLESEPESEPEPLPIPEPNFELVAMPRPDSPAKPKLEPPEPKPPAKPKSHPQATPNPVPESRAKLPAKPRSASRPAGPSGQAAGSAPGSSGLGQSKEGAGTARSKSKGTNSGPVLISSFDPPYPPSLLQKHIGASVILQLDINASGAVTSATVARGSGYPEFDQAARKTVIHWRFRPAQRNGVAIPFRANQRVVFRP